MALVPFIAALLSRWRSASSTSDASPHIALGRTGEKLAVDYLRAHGFKILWRNFRAPKGGEVDIVCREKATKTLVFIEVKTRTGSEFGDPASAVTPDKQHLISRGALAWLRLLDNPDIHFRFDIVEVLITKDAAPAITLIRDAFKLSNPYIY